ncbi:hypothetical protein ACWDSJ_26140 [Nocardia sp. NPDC003482]
MTAPTVRPTARQLRLLKEIHAQYVTAATPASFPRAAGRTGWDARRVEAARLGRGLETVAAAAGVPGEWVEQVRERGTQRLPWNRRLNWRVPARVTPRAESLARLASEARQAQDVAAVIAGYGDRGRRGEVGTAQLIDRKLRALAQRIAALSWVLEVTPGEADQLWGAQSGWKAVIDSVRGSSVADLAERWRAHARSYTVALEREVAALSAAGMTGEEAQLGSRAPDVLVRISRNLLGHTASPVRPSSAAESTASPTAGHAIAAAATAAVEFSHLPDTEVVFTPPCGPPRNPPFLMPGIEP